MLRLSAVVGAMIFGAAVVLGARALDGGDGPTVTSTAGKGADTSIAAVTINGGIVDVADLYERLSPSIVEIHGNSTRAAGTGSGVVFDTSGHILTNYHVVQGFSQIDVRFLDGTSASASVVGFNAADDLAVIRVDVPASLLKPVTIGNSTKLRIGQQVIAIGNPFDLRRTVTQGAVSGLNRSLGTGRRAIMTGLIQTDTVINPGNSGGGLFTLNGELVGITNAIENPTGNEVFVGVGYAIPATTIERDINAMLGIGR